jgi:hypothetical protein
MVITQDKIACIFLKRLLNVFDHQLYRKKKYSTLKVNSVFQSRTFLTKIESFQSSFYCLREVTLIIAEILPKKNLLFFKGFLDWKFYMGVANKFQLIN